MNRTTTVMARRGKWTKIVGFMDSHRAEMTFVLSFLAEINLLAIYALGIEQFSPFDQKTIPIVLCVLPVVSLVAGTCWLKKAMKKREVSNA